ncbi:MAG: NUDIX hydrolase [Alphaproteobacteria bacterium]
MDYNFDPRLHDRVRANLKSFDHRIHSGPVTKTAAVALTLVAGDSDEDGAAMLLTRRTTKLRKHAGQWALPGGRVDPGETVFEAALREMREEINLSLDESHYLGRLDDLTSRSGYAITPYVFWAEDLSGMAPNPDEVASIHKIPIKRFAGENAIQHIPVEAQPHPLLRLQLGDHRIHAPTGAFLLQLWEVGVHGRDARVDHYLHPDFTK